MSGDRPPGGSCREGAGLEAAAARAGVKQLAIPTPFPVGRVNVYLLEGPPLTLIDCGPNSGRSLIALERGLEQLGHSLREIEVLLITHQHVDHLGLAEALVERSGAQVLGSEALAAQLARERGAVAEQQEFSEQLMAEHGVAREVVLALRGSSGMLRAWGATVELDRTLADGEELTLGRRRLQALARPGHSPSDTLFLDHANRLLFSGDHLLAEITSNPVITPPLAGQERPRPLPTYVRSLERTAALDGIELVLPGHGEPIADYRGLIEARLRFHRRRARKIHGLLADGPATAHELARRMWGEVALMQAYLTLSEVLGHLDLLEEEGLVEPSTTAGVVRYRALPASSSAR